MSVKDDIVALEKISPLLEALDRAVTEARVRLSRFEKSPALSAPVLESLDAVMASIDDFIWPAGEALRSWRGEQYAVSADPRKIFMSNQNPKR